MPGRWADGKGRRLNFHFPVTAPESAAKSRKGRVRPKCGVGGATGGRALRGTGRGVSPSGRELALALPVFDLCVTSVAINTKSRILKSV